MLWHPLVKFWRWLRRCLRRSEWAERFFGLRRQESGGAEAGIVMIQIDGLSRDQFERALSAGRMPNVKRLIERDGHRVHDFFSGVPATTPVVQGELFYGVHHAVPAFGYYDGELERVVNLVEPQTALAVEHRLRDSGREPLLSGGSAYSDIYGGGAAEAHVCAAVLKSGGGWGHRVNPLAYLVSALMYAGSILRIFQSAAAEFAVAVGDVFKARTLGGGFWKDLSYIPKRVAVSAVLREVITIGAMLDVDRGLPIIHLNYLGYDEQAHRRGPESAFAHWALGQIDRSIGRLHRAARRSPRRDYALWRHADHGQAPCRPYRLNHGQTLDEAVCQALGRPPRPGAVQQGIQMLRAAWLHGRFETPRQAEGPPDDLIVVGEGPVGHVYLERQDDEPEDLDERLALNLIRDHAIPMVLQPAENGAAVAWTSAGRHRLPDDAAALLGADHPFLEAAAQDLATLCHHPHAGRWVVCGWCDGAAPVSFVDEFGMHAGAHPRENHAFAVLPPDAPLKADTLMRAEELSRAALRKLGRTASLDRPARPDSRTLRVMSYNVHSGVGMDGRLSLHRIARVIAQADPDVVALQELDVGRGRSQGVDQAQAIARELEMEFHFHRTLEIEEGEYGNAVLSRLPMDLRRAEALPGADWWPAEARGAMWVQFEFNGRTVHLFNTHLGLNRRDRRRQTSTLLSWIEQAMGNGDPVVFCGDLNAGPRSPTVRTLCGRLQAADPVAIEGSSASWPSFWPLRQLDHIFFGNGVQARRLRTIPTALACDASDHRPVVADLLIPEHAEETSGDGPAAS